MFNAPFGRFTGSYDLSPIPVDRLLAHPGFDVKIRHFAYQIDRFTEYIRDYLWDEEWPQIVEEVGKQGLDETSYNISKIYFEKHAEEAELARSRISNRASMKLRRRWKRRSPISTARNCRSAWPS